MSRMTCFEDKLRTGKLHLCANNSERRVKFFIQKMFYINFWNGAKDNTPPWEGKDLHSPWKTKVSLGWMCQLCSLLCEKERKFSAALEEETL